MTTIIPDFGLAATRQTPPPSLAVTTAQEISAQAQRLAQLPIATEDRRALLTALVEAAECLCGVATVIGTQVHQTALLPSIALPDRVRAEADRLYTEADEAASAFIRARRHLERAIEADEEFVLEQAKAARGGDL
ncbi:hypothetical protein ABT340_39230 [Streptosporangium sp. NPDC000239]|uniref:hypothetical protein n=1 Tax=Streptosporangium sp. NPDC000239 TaxID=3154248 RepID=UPI00332EAA9A